LRIVVPLVDRQPGKSRVTALGPLRQQHRLPVTGRRDHRHDPARVSLHQPVQQRRTANGPRPYQWAQQLGHGEVERQSARTARRAGELAHAGLVQAHSHPQDRLLPHADTKPGIRSTAANRDGGHQQLNSLAVHLYRRVRRRCRGWLCVRCRQADGGGVSRVTDGHLAGPASWRQPVTPRTGGTLGDHDAPVRSARPDASQAAGPAAISSPAARCRASQGNSPAAP
jgi:hypothetical protein